MGGVDTKIGKHGGTIYVSCNGDYRFFHTKNRIFDERNFWWIVLRENRRIEGNGKKRNGKKKVQYIQTM
jgi:hypothetical protein